MCLTAVERGCCPWAILLMFGEVRIAGVAQKLSQLNCQLNRQMPFEFQAALAVTPRCR